MAEWYDDPCFDEMVETVDGMLFKGETWRRLMRIKEKTSKIQVVPVAGIAYHKDALKIVSE